MEHPGEPQSGGGTRPVKTDRRNDGSARARESRKPGALGGLVAIATLALFVLTVCPTVPYGDGGELIAAADCFGVAHPPGYPLYTAVGWLALKVPAGEPALRMNLLSALFGCLTCGVVAWFLRRTTGSTTGAVAGALALGGSATFWWVATVAEVYTLHLLLSIGLLGAGAVLGDTAERRSRIRALMIGAVILGLGIAHHPTIVLVLPAALILALPRHAVGVRRDRQRPRGLPAAWLLLALGTAAVLAGLLDLSLIPRARADPPVNWGRPTTIEALLPHLKAVAYRHLDLGWRGLLRPGAWRRLAELLNGEFTGVILPVAALGLLGWPRSSARPPGTVRSAVAALIAASVVFGLRYVTEDVEVFYLPAFLGIAVAGGMGVALLCAHRHVLLRAVGVVAALAIVLLPVWRHASARALGTVTGAADYGRDVLGTVPRDGVLFVEADEAFPVLYLTEVLGERPDVTVYHRGGVFFRDLLDDLPLPPLPGEDPRARRIRAEQTFIDRELGRTERREVLFLGWPGYDPPRQYRLEPAGLLHRICRTEDPLWDPEAISAGYHGASVLSEARRTKNTFALALAAAYPLADGERAIFRNDLATAYRALEETARLAEASPGVQNYIGTLYGRLGDYERAIDAFNRAIAIRPSYLDALANVAIAYERMGDVSRAGASWRRLLEIRPGYPEAEAALRRLGRTPPVRNRLRDSGSRRDRPGRVETPPPDHEGP